LEVGWNTKELIPLEELLPYEVKPLDDGFKYLVFFLKPNCYAINDWRCLIKRVEKKSPVVIIDGLLWEEGIFC
jgi:hypothetical protein